MLYTGIGSRNVSPAHYEQMVSFAFTMASLNLILRSGKAAGSDQAFQLGHQSFSLANPNDPIYMEIYTPWTNFRNPLLWDNFDIAGPDQASWKRAQELAKSIHPRGKKLCDAPLLLHARNMYQALGVHLMEPSDFCIYCSDEENGVVSGGTASAVKLSRQWNIPTYNIRTDTGDDNVRKLWTAGSARDIDTARRIIDEWESNTGS